MSTYPDQLTVHVTQDDINKGRRSECRFCPIALATSRIFKPDVVCSVGYEVGVSDDHSDGGYAMSPAAKVWIDLFDEDGPSSVSPTTFVFQKNSERNLDAA